MNKEKVELIQQPKTSLINDMFSKIRDMLSRCIAISLEFSKQLNDILIKELDDDIISRKIGTKLRIMARPIVTNIMESIMERRKDLLEKENIIELHRAVNVYVFSPAFIFDDIKNSSRNTLQQSHWKFLEEEIMERIQCTNDLLQIPILGNTFLGKIRYEFTNIHVPEEIRLFIKQNALFPVAKLEELEEDVIGALKLKGKPDTCSSSECTTEDITTLIKQTLTRKVLEIYDISPDEFVNSKSYNKVMQRVISLFGDVENDHFLLDNLSSNLHREEL